MKEIFIYGIGDFAKLMLHYFKTDSSYNVIGFCADSKYINDEEFCKLPIISFEEINLIYPSSKYQVFVAIGYSNMRSRKIIYNKIKSKNYQCVNYISSKATLANNIIIGENNVILENVVIEPFANIGNNNVIWSSSNICHNTKIHSHCFIAAQTLVGGFSEIKENCFLGFNSTVLQNIVLEDETLVAAKTLINRNTKKCTKYMGIPAKLISIHKDNGIQIK